VKEMINEDVKYIMSTYDLNGDNKITLEELLEAEEEFMAEYGYELTEEDKEYYAEEFNKADKNGNGKLGKREIKKMVKEWYESY